MKNHLLKLGQAYRVDYKDPYLNFMIEEISDQLFETIIRNKGVLLA